MEMKNINFLSFSSMCFRTKACLTGTLQQYVSFLLCACDFLFGIETLFIFKIFLNKDILAIAAINCFIMNLSSTRKKVVKTQILIELVENLQY